MPNMEWSGYPLRLGKIAEHYARLEFLSYGFEVYMPEIDDHGVDFIARSAKTGEIFEVQVKSICKSKYAYIPKDKITLDEHHLVCFLRFADGEPPEIYVIPAVAWKTPNGILVDRSYDVATQKSKPEWGIQYSAKNASLLAPYRAEAYFKA